MNMDIQAYWNDHKKGTKVERRVMEVMNQVRV
jgi:hypothetical protein